MRHRSVSGYTTFLVLAFVCAFAATGSQAAVNCTDTITADVVVLDNPTVFNRLGAQNPNWITYALRRDVVDKNSLVPCTQTTCTAGNVMLRPDKRTRPLVVRSVEGMCLTVHFQNLLDPNPNPIQPPDPRIQDGLVNNDQVADRCASFHAQGAEVIDSIANDGSMVGNNPGADASPGQCGAGGLVAPGGTITYNLYTPHEGTFPVNSYGATIGSEGNAGNLGLGMFAQLNVEPPGARMYRSQVTEEELRLATTDLVESTCTGAQGEVSGVTCNPGGQPIIDYEALYPDDEPWISEGKAGLPILNMLTADRELVHSDINAIIVGPNADGTFPASTYPLESAGRNNPQLPDRLRPFREFSSVYHDEQTNSQAFPRWYNDPVLKYTLHGVGDAFMINYGSGGIGSEIIANRLHTGPMHDCTDCTYEEFFLSSQTVGDPGMLVEFPANTGIEQCDPKEIAGPSCWRDPDNLANGPIPGNFALYQEDPGNIHHGYVGDHTKIRNIHAGAFEQHIFHLHNNQWLHNPHDDSANYLDAQEIMPGSGHTYELVNGGLGNRNKSVGDAIFHCHFYPHFAQGMWYHLRIHDVFERGTVLAVSGNINPQNPPLNSGFHTEPFALRSGQPAVGARALPDGELPDGSPIPAVVPLPGRAMAHMPATVSIAAVDRGGFSLLGGRTGPDGIPDSGQAVVKRFCDGTPVDCADAVAGLDNTLFTPDDVSPGFPFWLAGNECGVPTATNPCPQGIVGQRAPTPPLDMLTEAGATANGYEEAQAGGWDGGLPRHSLLGYVSGGLSVDTQNRLDFSKNIELAQPVYFPETGTDLEKVSMAYHAVRNRPSAANNLNGVATGASFVLNGAPPVPGGPFNDPCIDDAGAPLTGDTLGRWFDGDRDPGTLNTRGRSTFNSENPRTYKIANVQFDAVFNKVGYHYPQERIIALWEDVAPTVLKQRPPEPLVMRFNTFDCGKVLHTNLVPHFFELDDFQVRTPTDIIGQHIHLPKWDLTTGDGAANGWNYEDGTHSPGAVQERIHAINEFNELARHCVDVTADPESTPADIATACVLAPLTLPGQLGPIDLAGLAPVPTIETGDPGGTAPGLTTLVAKPHPFFGNIPANPQTPAYLGARTTIQRILVDPVVNVAGVDRGLGLTFSHDHYGPSTFQQLGVYSTILAEPAGSTWRHNESGAQIGWLPDGTQGTGGRPDGGPTTWQAAILPPAAAPLGSTVRSETIPAHREFYFEMSDFQHAYEAGFYVGANANGIPVRTGIVTDPARPFDATIASAPDLANTWFRAVNPPLKLKSVPFPDVVTANAACPGPAGNNDPDVPRPCAEAINISHSSMWVTNYRNEPVGLRVFDPKKIGPDGAMGAQAGGLNTAGDNVPLRAGDLAFALQTRIDRAIPQLNTRFGDAPYPPAPYCQGQGTGDGINCDRRPGDPFTPIMRTYQRDEVKIKIQSGATEEQHQATVHGVKWLSNSSAFGRSPNSGWRNFQSHGISEQFSLQVPVNPDPQQQGATVDYLYATNATRDGFWTGTWGILRSYGQARQDLVALPGNPPGTLLVENAQNFAGVCPRVLNQRGQPTNQIANLVQYNVTAVLANDILPNNLGVFIPPNAGGDSDNDGIGDNEGGPLTGPGTLVYNRRGTGITVCDGAFAEDGTCFGVERDVAGPLHDPTAILYVRTEDMVNPNVPRAGLKTGVPVEPLVLRAKAGDCIQVTLRNRLPFTRVFVNAGLDNIVGTADDVFENVPDPAPDLAGWQDLFWVVNRDLFEANRNPDQMRFFNNNLVRPSSYVGLHAQLVEYDASRDDGVLVGVNAPGAAGPVPPGGQKTYSWYAGDLRHDRVGNPNQRRVRIVAEPVEFGGTNLLSADRVKQPQKGLFGALVIEPARTATTNTTWVENTQVPDNQGSGNATRLTRAQATVTAPVPATIPAGSGGTFREGVLIGHKITNLRWADGSAVINVNQGELGREGAEDSGHAGFNYATEPPWFRFKLAPDAPFGNAGTPNSYGSIENAHAMYANDLVTGETNTIQAIAGVSAAGDPVTPVFRTTHGQATRLYVLNGASTDRDGTFILHGHLWQRDPYVCPGQADLGLAGRCNPTEPVPSRALGFNRQGKWMGSEEGMGHAYGHWPILFTAGGTDGVPGDYLFRDYSPSGNEKGQFGILRVN